MGPIQEMERQRQERISASRQNRNKFKFNNPKNQTRINKAINRKRSTSLDDLYQEYPLISNEEDPLNGRSVNNAESLLFGTTTQQPVTGGKNKRKYNKRKLKTKIDKIPKKYILKL